MGRRYKFFDSVPAKVIVKCSQFPPSVDTGQVECHTLTTLLTSLANMLQIFVTDKRISLFSWGKNINRIGCKPKKVFFASFHCLLTD